jgi:hypothetical protein
MTSQGTPHGRSQRAIRDWHLRRASMAARELETVSLADALALSLLTAEVGDDRWPRAAARWVGCKGLPARAARGAARLE